MSWEYDTYPPGGKSKRLKRKKKEDLSAILKKDLSTTFVSFAAEALKEEDNPPKWVDKQFAEIDYKFNEKALLEEFQRYVDSTYSEHYAGGEYQATEIIIDAGHGIGFTLGNVIKYAKRYGKKEGYNRKDLLKMLHYSLLALAVHDSEESTNGKK